jgi:hypothetical protein
MTVFCPGPALLIALKNGSWQASAAGIFVAFLRNVLFCWFEKTECALKRRGLHGLTSPLQPKKGLFFAHSTRFDTWLWFRTTPERKVLAYSRLSLLVIPHSFYFSLNL